MGIKYNKKKQIDKKRQKKPKKKAVSGKTQSPTAFKIGDNVVVKQGTLDADYQIEIGGWQGKIVGIEINDDGNQLIEIKWDSITLNKMPQPLILECERDNLDWSVMTLEASEVYQAGSRDKEEVVTKGKSEINNKNVQPLVSDDSVMPYDMDEIVWKNKKKTLIATTTGEPYQPARIYYELTDPDKILEIFSKLRCMDYDPDQFRWVWLYHAESKKLKFQNSYSKIPKNLLPIVIGSFFIKNNSEMFLNVNSFERVTKAITFFDKYLPKTIAKVTDVAIVNKMFSNIDCPIPNHQYFFDKKPSVRIEPEKSLKELSEVVSSATTPSERLELATAHSERMSKEPLPEVERLPSYFYEDGIKGLEFKLKMRTIIAHEQWSGNKNFSFYDLMQKIKPKLE